MCSKVSDGFQGRFREPHVAPASFRRFQGALGGFRDISGLPLKFWGFWGVRDVPEGFRGICGDVQGFLDRF